MSDGITLEFDVHFSTGRCGQRMLNSGEEPEPLANGTGRVPRIARLMALAIRFDDLVRTGEVADFAEIAALGQVTRARVSQITNLLNLAPDIQQAILFHPLVVGDRDAVSERAVRVIAGELDWEVQRTHWNRVKQACSSQTTR